MPAHKKPSALKRLHGSRRSTLNTKEPKFTTLPNCPEWLHPLAKEEWQRVMFEFGHTGLITAADESTLAAYCQSYARWRQAEEQLEREGDVINEPIVTRSGHISGLRLKKHPLVNVAKDAQQMMFAVARLFGMTPSSRTSLHVPEQPASNYDADDAEFEAQFGTAKIQ